MALMPVLSNRLIAKERNEATIIIKADGNDKLFFQTESDSVTGYVERTKGEPVKLNVDKPQYYYYISESQRFITVYVTPGATMEIIDSNGSVTFKGDNAEINHYILSHPVVFHVPQELPLYSAAWREYAEKEVAKKIKELEESGLPEDFIHSYTIYHKLTHVRQLLSGPENMKMFMGTTLNLDAGYYDFLKKLELNDSTYLTYPKWFTTILDCFERMEKEKMMPVHPENYLSLYANRITNPQLRGEFILRYIDLAQQKGFSADFDSYLVLAKKMLTKQDDLERVAKFEAIHNAQKEQYKTILTGEKAPAFTAYDINGKKYESSQFAGKVLVLDFWFSGCIPCKAEMPYMEQIAKELKDQNILFISLSTDTGKQLMEAWRKIVSGKNDHVVHLNLPDGYKSEIIGKYFIKGVPRIVVIDAQGNIVDAFAKRPSDPKFRSQLENLLGMTQELTSTQCNNVIGNLMQAKSAETKESIMREFFIIARDSKSPMVHSVAGMMKLEVIKALLLEGKKEQADAYLESVPDSPFKRDVLFLSGNTCFENENIDMALPLVAQAAGLTMKIASEKELSADELKKQPMIYGLYANLLIQKGRIEEAAPYMVMTYEKESSKSFTTIRNYAHVCIFKKDYTTALPLIEEIIRTGKGNREIEGWLKECWFAVNAQNKGKKKPSEKGFTVYLEELKKVSAENMANDIAKKQICIPAPLFSLVNMNGETVSLQDLKGKVVILDFWATWCGPCKASFDAMQMASNKYKNDKDVVFLFINTLESSMNPEPAVKKYIAEKGYDFNVLFDKKDPDTKKCAVFESFQSAGVPVKFIIDKTGNIRYKCLGFSGSNEEVVAELSGMIEAIR